MKKVKLKSKQLNINGTYYINNKNNKHAFIVILGSQNEFNIATSKYLKKYKANVLGINPYTKEKKCRMFSSFPLERIKNAIEFLKSKGIEKIGIVGGSTWSTIALASSSLFEDISLCITFSPCDFVLEGLAQGKNKKMKEWVTGTSSLTYNQEILPYHSYSLNDEDYWKITNQEYIKNKEPHLIDFYNSFEETNNINNEEYIKIENAKCNYVFFAAKDDTMWNSPNHVLRMENRLNDANYEYSYQSYIYEFGTHFLFPKGMIKYLISIGGSLIFNRFQTYKKHKKECNETRNDIDKKLNDILFNWINESKDITIKEDNCSSTSAG